MNRQQLLNTFVEKTNGKGQSLYEPEGETRCCYVPDDPNHPGCAIGCQPELDPLRPQIKAWERVNHQTDTTAEDLLNRFPELKIQLKVENDDDIEFLLQLQELHDAPNSWHDDKILVLTKIQAFAKDYGLTVPSANYYTETTTT